MFANAPDVRSSTAIRETILALMKDPAFALSFTTGIAQAFGGPAYQSLIPSMVGQRDLTNAIALNAWQHCCARLALTRSGLEGAPAPGPRALRAPRPAPPERSDAPSPARRRVPRRGS